MYIRSAHGHLGRDEGRFNLCNVDLVFFEIQSALRLVPSDHGQIVYTWLGLVKGILSTRRAGS